MARAVLYNTDMIAKLSMREGTEVGDVPKKVDLKRLRFDGSSVVDLADLSEIWVEQKHGTWLLHAVQVPGAQLVTMTWGQRKKIINDNGTYRIQTEAELLIKAKREKRESINAERDRRVGQGLRYTFPDTGREGTIQTRTLVDARNLQGLGSKALKLKLERVSTTLPFRDAEDVIHQLTPDEMIAMTETALDWVQAHYTASWQHKDVIGKTASEGLTSIEEVKKYDHSTGWP